uniref:NADH-ubiquinone oxidoreductase chain 5 n=1 Tax=Orohermes crepusculus TaxID=1646121 RepID=A0A8K1T8B1_9NEOP|nr:NADH dehydrogenase subunit 5 [Orohermes crepusculus]
MNLSICLISFYILSFISVVFLVYSILFIFQELIIFIEWEVLSLNSSSIVMTILLDWMSLLFMSFVLMISALVIYYSKGYMFGDFNINRFILLVLLFVLSMMFLIISPNLISILLGWDGLGLVSYCLVIYYQNIKSYNAGMITVLSNRIGDVALLMAIAWMLNFGSWNYIFYLECMNKSLEMEFIGLMVILAGMTKSAQIPFSSWLPAAMAAPTPVSALVHSSTLVTAGVYLLIRFNILMVGNYMGNFLLLIGCLTMFMAGLGANFEFDLKKIIALSTLSQLGLMMSILAMGFPLLAYFHLLTHALFKALLFMCAGAIIHNLMNSQDIRVMGSLVKQMPLTISCMHIANLALCGTPFLAGFYSKDLILEMVSLSYINLIIFLFFFISTGLTVCYSFRLIYYSMSGSFHLTSLHPLHDEEWNMLKGMLGLLFFAIMGGSMLSWLIFPSPIMICLPLFLKVLALLVSVLGGWLGYELSKFKLSWYSSSLKFYKFVSFSGSMWFMPLISTKFISFIFLKMGYLMIKLFDQGWSEMLGGQGLYKSMKNFSMMNQIIQNNNLKIYLMSMVMWMIILIIMYLF